MKTIKLENGNKVKVFEKKKDLIDKLGFTESEAKIVMKYQRDFPELLQHHKENDFIIDLKIMWTKLGNPYNQFNKWYERKVLKNGYIENKDFLNVDKIVHIENTNIKRTEFDHYLTVDCAKHVAMSEQTDIGREIRDYFILMERALREMDKWLLVREPEKEGDKQMKSFLKSQYMLNHNGKEPTQFVYSNESDMLNQALLGAKAKQIRAILEADDCHTRDHLRTEVNQALYELQMMNSGLIMGNMDYKQRKKAIKNICDTKFIHIKLIAEEMAKAI